MERILFVFNQKVAGKTKFNEGKNPASEIKMTHKISSTSDYILTERCSGQTTLDGNFHLFNRNSFDLSLHVYSDLYNKTDVWKNRFLLRAHMEDLVASVGVEDFDIINESAPSTLSLSLLKGDKNENRKIWGGLKGTIDLPTRHLKELNFLGAYKATGIGFHNQVTVAREASEEGVKNSLTNRVLASYACHDRVDSSADWTWDLSSNSHKVAVANQFKVDDKTIAKVKVDNKNTVSFAFKRLFGSLVHFSFNSQVTFIGNDQGTAPFASYRLGAQVEIKE